MHAAVSPVAEVADAQERVVPRQARAGRVHEGGHGRAGHSDVEAQHFAFMAMALGDVVADVPQLGGLCGKDVGDSGLVRLDRRSERRFQQLVEVHGVRAQRGGELDEHRVRRELRAEGIS